MAFAGCSKELKEAAFKHSDILHSGKVELDGYNPENDARDQWEHKGPYSFKKPLNYLFTPDTERPSDFDRWI